MKAGRIYNLIQGNHHLHRDRDQVDVYVNIEGTHIPVRSARYDPPQPDSPAKVVIGLDRLKLLLLLEDLKKRTGEEHQ